MVITPDYKKEVKLDSGITIYLKPLTARNLHVLMALTSLNEKFQKIASMKDANLTEEDTKKLLEVIKASVAGWNLEEEFTPDKLLDKLFAMDVFALIPEIVTLNFRNSTGDSEGKARGKGR